MLECCNDDSNRWPIILYLIPFSSRKHVHLQSFSTTRFQQVFFFRLQQKKYSTLLKDILEHCPNQIFANTTFFQLFAHSFSCIEKSAGKKFHNFWYDSFFSVILKIRFAWEQSFNVQQFTNKYYSRERRSLFWESKGSDVWLKKCCCKGEYETLEVFPSIFLIWWTEATSLIQRQFLVLGNIAVKFEEISNDSCRLQSSRFIIQNQHICRRWEMSED